MTSPEIESLFRDTQGALNRGDLKEAEASCRRLLDKAPSLPQPWQLLSMILDRAGRLDEALNAIGRALQQAPGHPVLVSHQGVLLRKAGRFDEARQVLARVCAEHPGAFGAHFNLGLVLQDLGHYAEAVTPYVQALRLRPDAAEAREALAECCVALGDDQTALTHYGELIARGNASPAVVEAAAKTALRAGVAQQAVSWAEAQARRLPDQAGAWRLLGESCKAAGLLVKAAEVFEKAMACDPDHAQTALQLGNVLLATAQAERALPWFSRAIALEPQDRDYRSAYLLALQHSPAADQDAIFQAHVQWGRDFGVPSRTITPLSDVNRRKLRVGYLSPRFCQGPLAVFFKPVFERHDCSCLELYAYFNGGQPDEETRRFLDSADHWRNLSNLDTAQAQAAIVHDELDILVDLTGHSPGNRLDVFARRAAPLQLTWMDYFNTTGLPTMDGLIADPYLVPQAQQTRYMEKLHYLSQTRLAYQAVDGAPEAAPSAPCRRLGTMTFATFGRLSKVNEIVIDAWARLLLRVPDSRLLFKANAVTDPAVADRLRCRFAAKGVTGDRLVFRSESSVVDMLREYDDVDLVLDTFPFTGCATSFDALFMGVPVISLQGESLLSRQGASILSNLERRAWLTETVDGYIDTAVALAEEIRERGFDRIGLRQAFLASPLADVTGFTRQLETLYFNLVV